MKKKIIIITSIVAVVFITVATLGYFLYLKPHNKAVKDYKAVVSVIETENKKLEKEIKKLQSLVDSKDKPLDETLIETSKEAIKKAIAEKTIIEKMPFKTDNIIKATKKYSVGVDYSENIALLIEIQTKFETSQKQYKQFVTPSEDFILQRVLTIDEVLSAKPVTEDNDPNGQLHKKGGYTATIYLESKNVNTDEHYLEGDAIEKGTDGGGAVEVYANEEDAISRGDYLGGFSSMAGSTRVIGTTVIRASEYLTATQQKELSEKIVNAIAKLD